jgi:clathrin heavy chain
LIENLLRFFVEKGEKEYFTVTCYTCFDQIKPDVVMELAWRFNMMEFAMPFFIQITREMTSRVEHV